MQKMYQVNPDMVPAVYALNLSKRFRHTHPWAVRDLSFSCQSGTVTGLLGENGAGKTSTLRMLSTMLAPTEGSAAVCGHDTNIDPAKVRQSVGMLFGGTSGLYERLSAAENILYFARLNGLGHKEAGERLSELAEIFEMRDFLNRRAGTFSTGMRQKTLIARAIIHNPSVLLLDEPATGLDFGTRRSIYRFILRQKKLGKTIIFSSHDLTAVQEICDTLIVLHNGQLAAKGSPAELSRKGSLEDGIEELTRSTG